MLLATPLAWRGGEVFAGLGVRDRLARVPAFDPDLARHLVADSEPQWSAYCRKVGPRPLMDGINSIYAELGGMPYSRYARDRVRLERCTLRLADGLEATFGFSPPARYARKLLTSPARTDFELHQLNLKGMATLDDSSLAPASRLAILDQLIDAMVARGDPNMAMGAQLSAAHLELELGRRDRHRARLEAALRIARGLDDDYLACQILGELGAMHQLAGQADSMQRCFDEGVALARRRHFPDQVARLLLFEARNAAGQGRLALAADRLTEAQYLCESFGGGSARLRLALEYARFLSDLGCWELARLSLRQLPPLLREFPRQIEPNDAVKYEFDADCLRARAAFAAGDPRKGGRWLARWVSAMPARNRRVGLAVLFQVWSWGLQHTGRPLEALGACERGLAHCDSSHVPEHAIPLALRRARLLEQLGRRAEAARAIDDAARRIAAASEDGNLDARALNIARARLLLRSGQIDRGRAMLSGIFASLPRHAGLRDDEEPVSPERDEGLSLRDALHELARLPPAAGYGFELEWRSLARAPQREGAVANAADPGPNFAEVPHPGEGTHLVYHFLGNRLLRWTATRRGVCLDTLAVEPEACLGDVRAATLLLQTEARPLGAWFGPRTARVLRRLAQELLPAIVKGKRPGTASLQVSPDGPLAALPFEALPVGEGLDDTPLAAQTDVSYCSGWSRPAGAREGGPAVILSNPTLSPRLERRYAWSGPLSGSEAESRSARARWPGAIVLQGASATKPRFLLAAMQASCIYIAAHHVRDPGAPLLGFVPLAETPGASGDASFLEAADVRALDLSSCRLVVLASCASGAPYRIAAQPGPSLGDAFLDAGARSVVGSFWDVGDEETRAFMERFLAIQRAGGDEVRTLNQARREAMAGGAGVPPRVWAAWSIAVTWPRGTGAVPPATAGDAGKATSARGSLLTSRRVDHRGAR